MNIGITADVHLRGGGEHPERYHALEDILKQLREREIPVLAVAGDLFDENVRDYAAFEALCAAYPEIALHVIPGNHDPAISDADITADNVRVYTEPAVRTFDDMPFLFLPYRRGSQPGEAIAAHLDQREGRRWVLVSHCDYCGGTREVNPLEPGVYMPLSRKDLEQAKPETVFLGHIHKPVVADTVRYAGSPCGLDITETGRRGFLVYDTAARRVERLTVTTDLLFFDERFLVIPRDDETRRLEAAIAGRIESWNITPAEYPKVRLRVVASGYAIDRNAVKKTIERGFEAFTFHDSAGPDLGELRVSRDPQRANIAERARDLVKSLGWPYGGDEPSRDEVVLRAMALVYDDGGAA